MNEEKLPGESTITTLWIVGISLTLLSFCCALFTSLAGVIVSIVAIRKANKNERLFHENPEVYSPYSLSTVKTGKIVSIITLIISSLVTMFYTLYIVLIGSTFLVPFMMHDWDSDLHSIEDDATWDQETVDDWTEEFEEIDSDTLLIESMELDSIN